MIHKGANRYKVVVGDGNFSLPLEYQRVEYIENSYRQWIDTGWKNNYANDIYVEAYFKPNTIPSNANRCALLSNYNGNDYDYNFSLEARKNSNIRMHCYANVTDTADNSVSTNIVNKVCIKYSSSEKYVSCNDSVVQIPYNLYGDCPNSNRIFVDKAQRFTTFCCYFKLYGMKIYDNGVLVRDFIPCYRKSDSEAGLYDKANNVFYMNQGTGSFIVGNKIFGGTFTVPEQVEKKYYIRGTATGDFDFILQYIDNKTNEITTVTEHAVVDNNRNWEVSYSGKKIYTIESFYLIGSNKHCRITSIQFTETLDKLSTTNYSSTGDASVQYRGIFFDCRNLKSITFAKGTTLKSVTYSNGFMHSCYLLENINNSENITMQSLQQRLSAIVENCYVLNNLHFEGLICICNTSCFNGLNTLTNIFLSTKKETISVSFKYSPLTYDSMLRVANWLADLTGKTAQTVTFNQDTYDALTQEQKDTLYDIIHTQKNWTLATANP